MMTDVGKVKRDFLGNELKIGDEVVFMQLGYRSLMKGVIVGMSNRKATLTHPRTNTCSTESIQFYEQMVKVGGPR
jgi:hypothetical protein